MAKIICPVCGWVHIKKNVDKQRTNPQSRYFHGVVLPLLSEETGYTDEEMKGILKWKFKITSTSSLSTKEFEDFMSDVRRWASAELSCYLPEPRENIDNNFV